MVEITPKHWKEDPTIPFNTSSQLIARALQQKIQQLYGDFGSAAIYSGFHIKYCNEYTRIAIIRSRHGPHRFIATTIPFINYLDKGNVVVRSLYVGATIKHCNKFIKEYQQKKIETDLIKFKNRPEYEELCQIYRSCNADL